MLLRARVAPCSGLQRDDGQRSRSVVSFLNRFRDRVQRARVFCLLGGFTYFGRAALRPTSARHRSAHGAHSENDVAFISWRVIVRCTRAGLSANPRTRQTRPETRPSFRAPARDRVPDKDKARKITYAPVLPVLAESLTALRYAAAPTRLVVMMRFRTTSQRDALGHTWWSVYDTNSGAHRAECRRVRLRV